MSRHDFAEFSRLPDEAELWVYGFSKPLEGPSEQQVRRYLESFLPQWASHGVPVQAAYRLEGNRFVLMAAHCDSGLSGCSIDSSVRLFKALQAEGLDGLDRTLVFYCDSRGEIRGLPFMEFQKRVDAGEIDGDTPVFDTTIRSLKELRDGGFEKPFKLSWHARSFPLPVPEPS